MSGSYNRRGTRGGPRGQYPNRPSNGYRGNRGGYQGRYPNEKPYNAPYNSQYSNNNYNGQQRGYYSNPQQHQYPYQNGSRGQQPQYSRNNPPQYNQPYTPQGQQNTNAHTIPYNSRSPPPTHSSHNRVSNVQPKGVLPDNLLPFSVEKRKQFSTRGSPSPPGYDRINRTSTVNKSYDKISSPSPPSPINVPEDEQPVINKSDENTAHAVTQQNLEFNERQKKILEWKNKKSTLVSNGSVKKKSLMKFSKKTNKKMTNLIAKKNLDSNILDREEEKDENENNKDEKSIQNKSSELPSHLEETTLKDVSNQNINGDGEVDATEDLDLLLSTLQNKETNRTKINVIDNDIDTSEPIMLDQNDAVDDEAAKLLKMLGGKNKKDVPEHDFSTEPFVKKFYKESDFIKTLSKDEVRSLRETDSIHVKGKNVLKPILEWSQLGLPASIFSVLQNLKYDSPTPIQCEALPHIMDGNDFIGIAQTGSGKTIAFLLPLFRQLLSNKAAHDNSFPGATPRAVLITPTRELALQIAKTAKPFADNLNMTICKCYGGQSISKQIADLKKGTDIIVGTPGRIIDLLCTNGGRILNFSHVTYLVMDEADRMFDMGFEPQILKILKVLRPDRQTVLFSATFPPKIQALARKILKDPTEVLVGSKNLVNENISQHFEIVPDSDAKFNKLLQILGTKYSENNGKVLIFMERQDACDKMVKKLLTRGYAVMSLHGGKDQTERGGTIKDFKNGIIDIIVATSVASRGLDVDNLNLVINYDAPSHIEDYVHRVGRTGRAGNKGEAYTILTPDEEKCASDLVRVLKASHLDIPAELGEMATKFEDKIKEGDVKFGSGFGGKGLEKLQAIRDKNEKMEKQVYLKDEEKASGEDRKDGNKQGAGDSSTLSTGFDLDVLKNFKVEYSSKARGLEATCYYAKLNINDLPPTTRWYVTTHENYLRVIELTGTSITTRGRYYPPGQDPKPGDDPKLYVLVEGPNEVSVGRAVGLFRENVLRGLERETSAQGDDGGAQSGGGKYAIV